MYNVYFVWCVPHIIICHHVHALKIPTFSNQFKSFVWLYFLFSLQIFLFFRCFTHTHLFFMYHSLFSLPSLPVHGPFNSNVPARSSFSRPRRIYHVPVVKRPTIRDIHNSAVKKISPFYMEKFAEPSLHPSDKIMFSVYKKKRRIFTRSN